MVVAHKIKKYFSCYDEKQMTYLQRQSSLTSVASLQSLQAFLNKAGQPHCTPIIPSHECQKQKIVN
jgi:hypothetical protein